MSRSTSTRLAIGAALLLMLTGVAVRIRLYADNRSLRQDEAWLASNIVPRTWAGLLAPLDNGQGAPAGFLVLTKLSAGTFGVNDLSLRLISFVSGLNALPLLWLMARDVSGRIAATAALLIFLLSAPVLFYALDLKQYSTDAAAALVISVLTLHTLRRQFTLPAAFAWAFLGAALVWLSHPAAFILGGAGLAFFYRCFQQRDRRGMFLVTVAAAAWLVSFAINIRVTTAELAESPYLLSFWDSAFWPVWPITARTFRWPVTSAIRLFVHPLGLESGGLGLGLAILGGVAIWRRDRAILMLLVAPITFAMLASAARKYPFEERLLMFAAPASAILVAEGLRSLWILTGTGRLAAAAFAACLVLPGIRPLFKTVQSPPRGEDLRPALEQIQAKWQTGDLLYVDWAATPMLEYYRRSDHRRFFADITPITWQGHNPVIFSPERYRLGEITGHPRVWVIGLPQRHGAASDWSFFQYTLDRLGTCQSTTPFSGGIVCLYDLTRPPPPRQN